MKIKPQTDARSRSRCFMRPGDSAMQPVAVMQIRDALQQGIASLNEAFVPSSELSAELLLIYVLGRNRTWLYTHSEDVILPDRLAEYLRLILRRASGIPTQYLTGNQEFWGLDFEVTPAVLIPRPETEHLVEVALDRIGSRRSENLRIADVGTGSGCIAVALAKELPNAQIVATDLSCAALDVGKRNAARHNVSDRIRFYEADLLRFCSWTPLEPQPASYKSPVFDVIVSNPPYVATSEKPGLQREVREHEPEVALFAGPTGVEIYPRLIEQAEARLVPNGLLIVELGFGAAERVKGLFESRPRWTNIAIADDLAAIPRVLAGSFAGAHTGANGLR